MKVEGYPSVRYRMLVTRERCVDGAVGGVNGTDQPRRSEEVGG